MEVKAENTYVNPLAPRNRKNRKILHEPRYFWC